MIPVLQDRFGGGDAPPHRQGNCVSAALASILEVPLSQIGDPESGEARGAFYCRVAREHGCCLMIFGGDEFRSSPTLSVGLRLERAQWIACVPSRWPGADPGSLHALVMRGLDVAHDPNPRNPYSEIDVADVRLAVLLVAGGSLR